MATGRYGAQTASRFGSLVCRPQTSKAHHLVGQRICGGRTIAATMPPHSVASRSSSALCCARRFDARRPARAIAALSLGARCRMVDRCHVPPSPPGRPSVGIGTGGNTRWGIAGSRERAARLTARLLFMPPVSIRRPNVVIGSAAMARAAIAARIMPAVAARVMSAAV